MKIMSVVGARPQFIKAAPVCRALRASHEEILVHSGQHYDHGMSNVFFEELGIPEPDHNLAVGSGRHGKQTGEMLGLLEEVFLEEEPDAVIVYGDTNTTVAAALAASKAGITLAHVEAGLRSFNRAMPEEINRVVTDHVSDVLLCPTSTAVENLHAEGKRRGVHLVGDVMLDTARFFAEGHDISPVLERFGATEGVYYFATVHRASNSDDADRLGSIIEGLAGLDLPVIWALHPRTRKNIESFGLESRIADAANLTVVPPVAYGESIALLRGARAVLTDSGGMQKEAYFFGTPCVTLREETEWVETVELGWNRLAGWDAAEILSAVDRIHAPDRRPDVYGDGHAAEKVVAALESELSEGSADG